MNKLVHFFIALLACCSVSTAFAAKGDTQEIYLDYWNKKCEPHQAHYIRIAFKEGNWWHVQDLYAATGSLYMDGMYSDDSMTVGEGMTMFFHPNGRIQKKARYIKGNMEGVVKLYDTLGRLVDSGIYAKGVPRKARYKWDSEGHVIFKGVYDEEGYGVGQEWEYFADGKIASFGNTAVENKRDSIWTYYYKTGVMSAQDYYDKGNRMGRICYDEKGEQYIGTCEDTDPEPVDKTRSVGKKINAAFEDYAENNNITGMSFKKGTTIIFSIYVKEDGTVDAVYVLHGVEPKLDKYLANELKTMKFVPAKRGNRNVKSKLELPIPLS